MVVVRPAGQVGKGEGNQSRRAGGLAGLGHCRPPSPPPARRPWDQSTDSVATSFQFGIARIGLALERPDVGHVADMGRVAVDHRAALVAGRRDQLGEEAHGHLHGGALHPGGGDLGLVDADELELDGLVAPLALADGADEAVIDIAAESCFSVLRSPSAKAVTTIS